RLAAEKAHDDLHAASRGMTSADVATLEAHVTAQPEDLAAREQLLWYYCDLSPLDAPGLAARRAHVLWGIAHHPDSELAGTWNMRRYPTSRDRNPDPEGASQAARSWIAQTARPDAPVRVFVNAARFFEGTEKRLAEQNWLAAEARQPG